MANFSSKKQNAYMWAKHPAIAKRITDRMKRSRGKHPVKGLPRYSRTAAARRSRSRR